MNILESLCKRITDIFYKGYGYEPDCNGNDFVLPIDAAQKWVYIASLTKPCILHIYNKDAANELEYTFNDKAIKGGRVPYGTMMVLDHVKGVVLMRSSDPTLSVNYVNVYWIAVKDKDY